MICRTDRKFSAYNLQLEVLFNYRICISLAAGIVDKDVRYGDRPAVCGCDRVRVIAAFHRAAVQVKFDTVRAYAVLIAAVIPGLLHKK